MTNEPLKEGYIRDWATGKAVDFRKPEEKVRQEYEKVLYQDYDYAKEQLDIEAPIQRGEKNSLKNKNERADIVVYKTTDKNKRNHQTLQYYVTIVYIHIYIYIYIYIFYFLFSCIVF